MPSTISPINLKCLYQARLTTYSFKFDGLFELASAMQLIDRELGTSVHSCVFILERILVPLGVISGDLGLSIAEVVRRPLTIN